MANKLKNMELTSVDLCKQGANPDAQIKLFKSTDTEKSFFERIGERFFKMAQESKSETRDKDSCLSEIHDMTNAVQKSFQSILSDPTLDSMEKNDRIADSLQAFGLEVSERADGWSNAVNQAVSKDVATCTTKKGVMQTMDETKMSAEDRATLEALKQKYTTDAQETEKSCKIDPNVKKALDEVTELKKTMELKDMERDFEKYTAIGKKADELAHSLYDLKQNNQTAYNSVITAYDEMLNVQKSSSLFQEIGSGRSGAGGDLNSIVAEIRKNVPTLSEAEAVVKAFETNPSLDPFTGTLKN